jgi:hypothetical protein
MAKVLRCHRNTVGNIRRRFVTAGLQAALYHKLLPPRASKKLTGEVKASSAGRFGSSRSA